MYGPHSTRGAAASKAKIWRGSILKHADWKTARSFAPHYSKRIEKEDKVARRLLNDSNAQSGGTSLGNVKH